MKKQMCGVFHVLALKYVCYGAFRDLDESI